VWSQTADRLKAGPGSQRVLRLTLTSAAAALALAGSQVEPDSRTGSVVLGVVAALALAGTALLRSRATAEETRRWTRARSVSEALKSEVFIYLSGTGNYQGSDRDVRLEAVVRKMESEAGDLERFTAGIQPRKRELPDVHDVDSYLDLRVRKSQLEKYYEPKAALMRERLRLLKIIEVALALVAAALAATAAVWPGVAAWAAVVTTGGGALAAYIAAERYEFLWIEYSRTASELRRLLERRTSADGSKLSGAELVQACEQVISVQNEAWMAKWGEEEPGPAAS
jgi:hypothetical protein